jgi:hypothetical protein
LAELTEQLATGDALRRFGQCPREGWRSLYTRFGASTTRSSGNVVPLYCVDTYLVFKTEGLPRTRTLDATDRVKDVLVSVRGKKAIVPVLRLRLATFDADTTHPSPHPSVHTTTDAVRSLRVGRELAYWSARCCDGAPLHPKRWCDEHERLALHSLVRRHGEFEGALHMRRYNFKLLQHADVVHWLVLPRSSLVSPTDDLNLLETPHAPGKAASVLLDAVNAGDRVQVFKELHLAANASVLRPVRSASHVVCAIGLSTDFSEKCIRVRASERARLEHDLNAARAQALATHPEELEMMRRTPTLIDACPYPKEHILHTYAALMRKRVAAEVETRTASVDDSWVPTACARDGELHFAVLFTAYRAH